MPPIYTPKQTKELLNLPGSTLRRYSRVFKEYLSEEANRKRRNYTQHDIGTLARIRDLFALGRKEQEIKDELKNIVIEPEEATQEDITALALPGVLERVNEIKAIFEKVQKEQQEEIIQLRDRLQSESAQREELEKRLAALEEKQSKPWYRRLFGD